MKNIFKKFKREKEIELKNVKVGESQAIGVMYIDKNEPTISLAIEDFEFKDKKILVNDLIDENDFEELEVILKRLSDKLNDMLEDE